MKIQTIFIDIIFYDYTSAPSSILHEKNHPTQK